jgi:hypothetical protein
MNARSLLASTLVVSARLRERVESACACCCARIRGQVAWDFAGRCFSPIFKFQFEIFPTDKYHLNRRDFPDVRIPELRFCSLCPKSVNQKYQKSDSERNAANATSDWEQRCASRGVTRINHNERARVAPLDYTALEGRRCSCTLPVSLPC